MKRKRRGLKIIASFKKVYLVAFVIVFVLGISLEVINIISDDEHYDVNCVKRPKYSVYMDKSSKNSNDLLEVLHIVLLHLGYDKTTIETSWTLLWSPFDLFNALKSVLINLEPHQKVGQMPGTDCLTSKVSLVNTNSKYIPKAFDLPKHNEAFLSYAKNHKNALFLEKHFDHRGISMKNVSDIDMESGLYFAQEYVKRPFLVNGHKFDIGVYVVITSVDPLRAYWYKGDVGFRYCPRKYYPFDPNNLDKYIVSETYIPTWEVPTLTEYYMSLGYNLKGAFDIYVRSKGKDPSPIWEEILNAIVDTLFSNAQYLEQAAKRYPSQHNFFELMRFDFIVDEDLKVYLIEANMAPNLSAYFHKEHSILFEQLLYNVLSLTGIVHTAKVKYNEESVRSEFDNMISSQKHIAVYAEQCITYCTNHCDAMPVCNLCGQCLESPLKNNLLKAHTEFMHKGDFRRLIPQSMNQDQETKTPLHILVNMSFMDRLQHMWYQDKCNQDITWCT